MEIPAAKIKIDMKTPTMAPDLSAEAAKKRYEHVNVQYKSIGYGTIKRDRALLKPLFGNLAINTCISIG